MKRRLILFVALILILNTVCSCAAAETLSVPVHVEGAIFGGKNDDSIALTLSFDPNWLTEGDNSVYNPDLAAFASLLSADTYFREKDLAKQKQNRVLADDGNADEYDFTALLKAVGFPYTAHIESYKEQTYVSDGNDSVTMNLACSSAYNGCDLFIIAIRGCFSAGEWSSVFDPGDTSGDDPEWNRDHPEWTDRETLKGTCIAANRAMAFIDRFIAEHDDPEKPNCILVTGHSRGGAIAEIIGAKLEDRSDLCRTYAFNSMPVTDNLEAETYRTVFNILDSRDFFSDCLPFSDEKMFRYGRTLEKDLSAFPELQAEIAELKGREDDTALSEKDKDEYDALFSARFPGRQALQTPKVIREVIVDGTAAAARLAECEALIGADQGLGLESVCHAALTETADEQYLLEIEYCDAALILSVGKILAYGETALSAVKLLFSSDEGFLRIADFLGEHTAEISGGHLLLNTYVLAKNGFDEP